MKKIMLTYLALWLPAAVVSYFYSNTAPLSHILQWAFAAVMLIGWGINTAISAYRYPRKTLSVIFLYSGATLLIITALYSVPYGTAYRMLSRFGGILSYKPLDIIVMAILDFNVPHELYVSALIVILCLIGYLAGIFYRRIRPDPYRPKITGV